MDNLLNIDTELFKYDYIYSFDDLVKNTRWTGTDHGIHSERLAYCLKKKIYDKSWSDCGQGGSIVLTGNFEDSLERYFYYEIIVFDIRSFEEADWIMRIERVSRF